MNKVTLIGNFGKDVEIREAGEHKVANTTLATTSGFGDNKKTQWHNLVFWGKQAELVSQYCKKGSKVAVVGEIQYREYEKDGVKKYATDIIVREVELLTPKSEEQSTEVSQSTIQNAIPAPTPAPVPDDDDNGLPF